MIRDQGSGKAFPASLWIDLLGRPWRKDSRGPDAFDCVGLMLEMERRIGHNVPEYSSDQTGVELAMLDFEPIADPQPGDVIQFRSTNPRWHIGVVSGDGWMIHAAQGKGVVRERYNSFPWHARIEGFYRWKRVLSYA